jgi:UDP-N-acetylmuramate: L-alanyl-gamma-D-glutamyl-meso-diaminopimelate ligase
MKIHLIAIGGSAMHNLAIALKDKGYQITGSDDEIVEPSKTRLQKKGLLPEKYGWFPEKISPNLDAVILGMHAREDNPELLKARELGLRIYSYPEYLYEQTKDKKRVVIAGSHGKTTITAMILHVLKQSNKEFDYMVGASIEGFDTMVSLSESAPVAVFEGDEYLSSPIDRRPKFHLYKPHIAVISGISWDHINVFPTFEIYKEQFQTFVNLIEPNGTLFFYQGDEVLTEVVQSTKNNICKQSYGEHNHMVRDNVTYLVNQYGSFKLNVFGNHNLQNISAAKMVCDKLEIGDQQFYKAISTFKGAARRLQVLRSNEYSTVYLDFAHAPSKVKATVNALHHQFPDRKLIACLELHTFSSLNDKFLDEYKGTMDDIETAIVYFNPETIHHKRLPDISCDRVKAAFKNPNLRVFTDSKELVSCLKTLSYQNTNLLLMSSGNFGGIDLSSFAKELF